MTSKSDYAGIKSGKLKLKGNKSLFKADRQRSKSKTGKNDAGKGDPDTVAHGGWWALHSEGELIGGISIAFETGDSKRCYLAAMDNGKFTLGAPHSEGEEPAPEEVLSVIKTPDDDKISMKTGYGKFVGVDSMGHLVATADAVGSRERMIVVFQDGKTAMQSCHSGLFLSLKTDLDGYITVSSKTAKDDEIVNIRTNSQRQGPADFTAPEDRKAAGECETSYVKMYQHSKNSLKGRHISIDFNDKTGVKKAQQEGDLHELLLNRRAKTKSDKYC